MTGRHPLRHGGDRRAPVRAVARLLAVTGAATAATAVGAAALASLPTPSSPADTAGWLWRTDPLVVTAVIGCLLALAAGAYLTVVGLVAAGAATTGLSRLGRAADVIALPSVRRMVGGAVGVGLGLTPVTAGAGPAPDPTVVMDDLGAADPHAPAPSVAMEPLPLPAVAPEAEPAVPVPVPAPLVPPAPVPDPPAPPAVGPAPTAPTLEDPSPSAAGAWTIAPGEHLWAVAERTLAAAGLPVDDPTVDAYLDRLIEANRDRLVVADDPDLVFPGQEMRLPSP